ncbi:MAG: hypothetical protein Fur007_10560 [Rhodoferax sp.]
MSGYDAFRALALLGLIEPQNLPQWNAVVGLRNRLVHDYMSIDMAQIMLLLAQDRDRFVTDFLLKPNPSNTE